MKTDDVLRYSTRTGRRLRRLGVRPAGAGSGASDSAVAAPPADATVRVLRRLSGTGFVDPVCALVAYVQVDVGRVRVVPDADVRKRPEVVAQIGVRDARNAEVEGASRPCASTRRRRNCSRYPDTTRIGRPPKVSLTRDDELDQPRIDVVLHAGSPRGEHAARWRRCERDPGPFRASCTISRATFASATGARRNPSCGAARRSPASALP